MPSSSCFYLYTENLSLLVLLPIFACKKDTCQNLPVSLLYFSKITHLYSIKGIGIPSVQTSFPYIMMIWKQWQPADMVKLSDFSPFWLCAPAFQQVCLLINLFLQKTIPHGFPHVNNFLKKSTHILLHKKSKSMNPKNLTFFSYEAHSSFIVLFSPLTKHNLLFNNKF